MVRSEKSLSHDGTEAHNGIVEVPSAAEIDWTPEVERKLVRKIDIYLLPMLWLMNLLSWMDRANLGNANIAGLTADLKLSSNQFSLAINTYYFGYLVFSPVSTVILARTRPSLYVPLILLLWGVVTAAVGAIHTYPQLLVIRLFLGILESGLTPGATFILSSWYLPKELGKRSSFFMTSAQMGGAFGGLIAGGVMGNLEGARGIRGWRWLFIVEGVVTCFVAIIAVFILPDYPASYSRLTEAERHVAVKRLELADIRIDGREKKPRLGVVETIKRALTDYKAWVISIAFMLMNTTLVMVYFYPVLVNGLGYTDPIKAQYMTVPIWVVGFVFGVLSGFAGDHVPRWRPLLIIAGFALLTVMAICVCAVYDFTARYVLLAFMTGGAWAAFSQSMAYLAELFGEALPEVRAFSIGLVSATAQIGNIYGAYLFPPENAPKHLLGFAMVAGTAGLCALIFVFVFWKERAQRTTRQNGGLVITP